MVLVSYLYISSINPLPPCLGPLKRHLLENHMNHSAAQLK
jgi:hypothetical protein